MPVTDKELELVEQVKAANPWYWRALVEAMSIMPERRANYSPNADPHENFRVSADILKHYGKFQRAGITITAQDVAFMYKALKLARVLTGGDSDYEAERDGVRDDVNYSLLWRAIEIQEKDNADGYQEWKGT